MSQKNQSNNGKNPPRNAAERSAEIDHAVEKAVTNREPIPRETPNWAKDLPKPKK